MRSGDEIQEEEEDVLIKQTKDSYESYLNFVEQNPQMMIVH
jgi:hypothetical protein